jgi:hypothetical protein
MTKMPTTDTSLQSSIVERIDHLHEAVGWKRLTSAAVAERCKKVIAALRAALGEKLVAVALYGSWARGDADEGSDVDLLVIADDLPDHPIQRVRFLKRMAGSEAAGVQFYARTRKGFESYFGVMYLEFGLDAQVLYDPTGYLAAKLAHIRDIINEAGLYRVQKGRDLFWRWKNPPPACKWKLSWEGYDDGSGRTSLSPASGGRVPQRG